MKLDAWLKRDHSAAERLAALAGLCGALVEAHQRGVVRGGLEPASVEIEADGSCRLGLDPPTPGSRHTAPEAAPGRPPTAKAEIFCAGLIFYETLAGQPPGFDAAARKPLQDLRPDLPTDLTDAVMACLEADPDWRPADLSYLLAVVRGLQQQSSPAPARTPARRVAAPPRTFLEAGPRRTGDHRGPLTRVLPVVLVLVAIVATGGAWLWFEVLRPGPPTAPGSSRSAAFASPQISAAPANPAEDPSAALADSPLTPSPSSPLVTGSPRTSAAPLVPATPAAPPPRLSPTPGNPRPAVPSPAPVVQATPSAATTAPPVPVSSVTRPEPSDLPPSPADPGPSQPAGETGAAEGSAVSGPASIRAIAPFRLRPGAMNVLDVHGANLRTDHRAKLVVPRKREAAAGFTATRYQLRSPVLLLVFLQVDAAVRPGKYAFSLVGADGAESNAFTIEVPGR